MNVNDKFSDFINKNKLFLHSNKILLAVSGGPDSIFMLDLFHKNHYNFAICHVNFKLRGIDSDNDEKFVKKIAEKYNCDCFIKSYNTTEYAQENKISIEMAARELRYNYFEEIMNTQNFDYTAVAHHQDDAIETFFLNLTRTTGIRGLTGLRVKNKRIVRPILCFSRKEIINYLKYNNLQWRLDKTNLENIFKRNKIRNEIIPLFEEINQSFKQNFSKTLLFLQQTETIYLRTIEKAKKNCVTTNNQSTIISIEKLLQFTENECLLYEIVKQFGFNTTQSDQIYQTLNSESGKVFYSQEYKLIKDRNKLIINKLANLLDNFTYQINEQNIENEYFEESDIHFNFKIIENKEKINFKSPKNIVYIDYDKLKFPLIIRNWQNGDYFQPFGKNQNQKVSDFFINQKIDIDQKHKIKILSSAEKIVWICGLRADNRFRITSKTQKILKIEML